MIEFELDNKTEVVPPYGPVGSIVDIRTYRRWLPSKKRRETFVERNERVVDANLDLAKGVMSEQDYALEKSYMMSHMNDLLALPSGRSMWIAGTEANKKHPASSFNCSATAINRVEAFTTVFELLMLGTGVGFRVFESDINQLPAINKFNIEFKLYLALPKKDRQEDTTTSVGSITNILEIKVGDSRQGWIDALKQLLYVAFAETPKHTTVRFIFDSVRPLGERINGFGGTASGHQALKQLLQDVFDIFNQCPTDKLRTVDCLDVCCAIAKGVVAGNTRRSALLCLFQEGDNLVASAKVGLFDNPKLANKYYRIQSNNTEALGTPHLPQLRAFLEANPDSTKEEIYKFIDGFKPTLQWIKDRFEVIASAGDPGFANYLKMVAIKWLAVRKHRPNVSVTDIWQDYCDLCSNPCYEIILSVGYKTGKGVSFCNLTTLPVNRFVVKNCNNNDLCAASVVGYKLDKVGLEQAIRLNVRVSLRQTLVTMPRPELDDTQKAERLLGVSATGWIQAFTKLDMSDIDQANLMKEMNEWANNEADTYSVKLNVERPLMVCCVKPEGSQSKVLGSSSGVHWDWAPHYINRIQMGANDALAKTLKDQGFSWIPTPYDLTRMYGDKADIWECITYFKSLSNDDKELAFNNSNAVLFEFPVASGMVKSQGSVSAFNQLDNVLRFSSNYVDHMVSSTITVKEDEWEELAEELHKRWYQFVNAAFLSYYSGNHPLLPNEEITEDVYNNMLAKFNGSKWVKDGKFIVDEETLGKYEYKASLEGVDIDDVELAPACSTGACPTR